MGTIVQNYGPIYGEVVNGTVQGRPNGSVYVPLSNVISLNITASYVRFAGDNFYKPSTAGGTTVTGAVKVVAVSQDLASNIRISMYSDAGLTTQVGTPVDLVAGNFNSAISSISKDTSNNLVTGNTYYVVAQLTNNGVPVATSSVATLEAV